MTKATADPLPTPDERDWLPKDVDLDRLQWTTILYYLHETNPITGWSGCPKLDHVKGRSPISVLLTKDWLGRGLNFGMVRPLA
jgi:hypothetical protein